MFVRVAAVALALSPAAVAQLPQPPQQLPPSVALPDEPPPTVRLPRPEGLTSLAPQSLSVKRIGSSWQVWAGGKLFRDCGDSPDDANEVGRVVREQFPSEWAAIGTGRVVVEYGLRDGRPSPNGGFPRAAIPIDHRSVRVESVRGAWCLRDDANILLNFGPHRDDAEQAIGVARKYGFNRVGVVGKAAPVMTYFFAVPDGVLQPPVGNDAAAALARATQERNLTRTGIELPGVGFVGEKLAIDPRKVEVRRERGEYQLAHGADVLAKFGSSEWSARDAQRLIQTDRFTEFCRFGTCGLTFFLTNGQVASRAPFSAQATRFEPSALKVREMAGKWYLFDGGRPALPAGSAEEAEQLLKLVRAYGFDQTCRIGMSATSGITFLAKGR